MHVNNKIQTTNISGKKNRRGRFLMFNLTNMKEKTMNDHITKRI